jgi:hypothetical protein
MTWLTRNPIRCHEMGLGPLETVSGHRSRSNQMLWRASDFYRSVCHRMISPTEGNLVTESRKRLLPTERGGQIGRISGTSAEGHPELAVPGWWALLPEWNSLSPAVPTGWFGSQFPQDKRHNGNWKWLLWLIIAAEVTWLSGRADGPLGQCCCYLLVGGDWEPHWPLRLDVLVSKMGTAIMTTTVVYMSYSHHTDWIGSSMEITQKY